MKGLNRTSPFHQFTNPRRDKSVYFWSWGSHLLQFTCLNWIIDNGGSVVSFLEKFLGNETNYSNLSTGTGV